MALGNAMRITAVVIMWLVFTVEARAELCLAKIDNNIERKSGYRWLWRLVDGRQCWFYSNSIIPKEDLVWSYHSEDFDSDVKVLDRKFYTREELEQK